MSTKKPAAPITLSIIKKAMPSGTSENKTAATLYWSKRGGYAGEKSIYTAVDKLKALGFKYTDASGSNTPDGSMVGFHTAYKHKAGWMAYIGTSYGSTKDSNHFCISIKAI